MAKRKPKSVIQPRHEENLEAILENDVKESFDVFESDTASASDDMPVNVQSNALPEADLSAGSENSDAGLNAEEPKPQTQDEPAHDAKTEQSKPAMAAEMPNRKVSKKQAAVECDSDKTDDSKKPESAQTSAETVKCDGELQGEMVGAGSPTVLICPVCGGVYANDVAFCPKDGCEVVNIGTAESVWRNMSPELRTQIVADVMAGDIKNPKKKKKTFIETFSEWYAEKAKHISENSPALLIKFARLFGAAGVALGIILAIMIMNFGEFSLLSIILGILSALGMIAFTCWIALFGYAFGKAYPGGK